MPDLDKASADEKRKWLGCVVKEEDLAPEPDERFSKWVQRYHEGSWNVENGPLAQLGQELVAVNAVTFCTVGVPLFKSEDWATLSFPAAENNHRYHDAHSEVYKFLIDGLSRETLKKLADRMNVLISPNTEKTLKLLKHLIDTSVHNDVFPPFEVVSEKRRLADHEKRPAAVSMNAFDQFNADLTDVVKAVSVLKEHLAQRLGVTVESCIKRKEALMIWYPKFDEQLSVQPHYSICDIKQIVGKKVSDVQIGFRKQAEGVDNSELIILEFDDHSSIAIHTASNVGNLADDHDGLKPEDLTISFQLNYVPPLESP